VTAETAATRRWRKTTETTGVVAILNGEHDSAEAAAEAILWWLEEKRADERLWAAIVTTQHKFGERPLVLGRGPFTSKKRAETEATKLRADKVPWAFRVVELRKDQV